MLTFRVKIAARGCTDEFGLGPGVLGTCDVDVVAPEGTLPHDPLVLVALRDKVDAFALEIIETRIQYIPDDV